jgi:DNA-binding NarL/FixJ family response regulator
MIEVVIADDHAVVRAGLRALISAEPSLKLAGEAAGGLEAIELVTNLKPDILILDMSMPDQDGIAVTRQIKQTGSTTRILILTVHEDEALLREAIKAGASGYILKRAAETELISAINVLMRGDLYIDPSMMRVLLDTSSQTGSTEKIQVEQLTSRETEILKLIVQGFTNRQVAEELNLSVRTVEGHRANLSEKLGLKSRVELVRYAKAHGLIE